MAMNQAEREQYEYMMAEDQEAYKRRSSILKPKDETTKVLVSTGMKRRVSFHNLRKVQEFDKEKCDLHTDHQQEEPMHLTNNSDGLKPDNTFSASFVTGANPQHDQTMANNATMTFAHSLPQANSTPVRGNATFNPHNTTTALFKRISADCNQPPAFTPLQPIKSGRGGGDDFTSLFFLNIQAPGRTEQEPVAMDQGDDRTCALFANIAAASRTTATGTMNVTSSVFASLGMSIGPTKGAGVPEPMDVTSDLFEIVEKGCSKSSPVPSKPVPAVIKTSPAVTKFFGSGQPVQRVSPSGSKPAMPVNKSSPVAIINKRDIRKTSPVIAVTSKPIVDKLSPIAAVASKPILLNVSPSPLPKARAAKPIMPTPPVRVTPARKAKTPTTPLQTTPKAHRQPVGRTRLEVPLPVCSPPHVIYPQKEPSPIGQSPSFNFTTTINSPAFFMEGHNPVDSLPFKHLTTIEEKSAPNFTFETDNDSVRPLEEGEEVVNEDNKEEEEQDLAMEQQEDEKVDMSDSRWSMAFHGESPSGMCTFSLQAAEKRKQLIHLMTSARQDRSRSSSALSQSFKSSSPQTATNAWTTGNESQIELLEDIACPNQADLLQLSENTKTYPFKEAACAEPAITEQDTYTIEPKETTPKNTPKHQPAVPSPLVMSELTYVLHKDQSYYGFNSTAKKTTQHKLFGESLMVSPWTGSRATPALKHTFCDYTMNTKPLPAQEPPTYIEEEEDDGLEEVRQRFLQELDLVKKVSDSKRALYALMREVLSKRDSIQKAHKSLESQMKTSFEALLARRPNN